LFGDFPRSGFKQTADFFEWTAVNLQLTGISFLVKGKITGGRTPATRILLTFKKILLWWHECMGFGEIPWGDELF
jgi:hypothetical protein